MDYNQNGQNQQNNGNGQWDRWDSNASNSSYYNQPTHKPYRQGFMMASGLLGMLSITTCCTGILSLPLGALSILFAVLARRRDRKLNGSCILGVALSCIGMISSLVILAYTFIMLPTMLKDEAFRAQFDALTQQMYGMDAAEFIQEFYGYSIEEQE